MTITGGEAVTAALTAQVAKMRAQAELAGNDIAAALEEWAKSEHGYTDQSGNTTNSIQGQVTEASAEIVKVALSAGMNYDVFLELARGGKWAFLWPVIERHTEDIQRILEARLRI